MPRRLPIEFSNRHGLIPKPPLIVLGDRPSKQANSPFDMVEVVVSGMPVLARPVEFDSDIVNQNDFTNKSGSVVKPIKLSTSCPHCGHEVDVDPRIGLTTTCVECSPERSTGNAATAQTAAVEQFAVITDDEDDVDVFRNPWTDGLV